VKGRNAANAYPDDVQALVVSACRENREILLPASSLEALGHHRRSLTKVVRSFCMDCMGGNRAEVRRCTSVGCVLWPYRLGKNPFTRRKGVVR
jgi:hypothetical protein